MLIFFSPENLETLCIWDCRLPRPLDLSNLKYLLKARNRGVEDKVANISKNHIQFAQSTKTAYTKWIQNMA